MNENLRTELVFYYESRQNPNGDPGFENQPRLMPDGTILVTDVRIKRTIRDYAKNTLRENLFVDLGEEGEPVTADVRAKEILGVKEVKRDDAIDDAIELIEKTFDTPLFGALVPIRSKGEGSEEGNAIKITGPVQFGIGRSVNKVNVISPQISGAFVGKEKERKEQFRTFGKFYSVEYALIKIHGAINPMNLGEYLKDDKVKRRFEDTHKKLFECLWEGTNNLITRSKFPQRSVFYLEVTYDGVIYNDLALLIEENDEMKGTITALSKKPFKFEKLISVLEKRKDKIKQIRVAACEELSEDTEKLISELKKKGIQTVEAIKVGKAHSI